MLLENLPHDPARRGYVVIYQGSGTKCPGCDRRAWYVGRQMAECAHCSTALPLNPARGGR